MGNGKNLQELLRKQNMTVTKLSEKTGISPNTLYAIIKRDSEIKSTTISKISEALEIPINELTDILTNSTGETSLTPEAYTIETVNDDCTYQQLTEKLNTLVRDYQGYLKQIDAISRNIQYVSKQIDTYVHTKECLKRQLDFLSMNSNNLKVEADHIRNMLKKMIDESHENVEYRNEGTPD